MIGAPLFEEPPQTAVSTHHLQQPWLTTYESRPVVILQFRARFGVPEVIDEARCSTSRHRFADGKRRTLDNLETVAGQIR